MKPGETAFIIESNRIVREVTIVRCSGGLFLVRFVDTGGGIQVKRHRLFATREDAEKQLPQSKNQKSSQTPYDYMH